MDEKTFVENFKKFLDDPAKNASLGIDLVDHAKGLYAQLGEVTGKVGTFEERANELELENKRLLMKATAVAPQEMKEDLTPTDPLQGLNELLEGWN